MSELAVIQALVDASIRGVVIALAVAVVLAILRARSGAAAHAAWTAVMLAMLALPVAPKFLPALPLALPQPPALAAVSEAPAPPPATLAIPPAAAAAQSSAARASAPTEPGRTESYESASAPARPWWPRAAMLTWLFVAAVLVARVFVGWAMALRLGRRSRPLAGLTYESTAVATPVAVGVWSPRILVPSGWHTWSSEMRAAILAHELAHVRRHDTLISVIAHVNRAIFWFHPLAWWLERRIAAAAEQACDDEALETSGDRARYAELLVFMAESTRTHRGRVRWQGAGILGRRSLGRRIDRVLDKDSRPPLTPVRQLALLLLSASIIVPGVACQHQPPPLKENPQLKVQFAREAERNGRYEAAKSLTLEQAKALEARVLQKPDDLELTSELLYFYLSSGAKIMGWNEMVAARRPHLLRMIERHPDSDYVRWPIPRRLDPDGWDQARAIWMKHLSAPNVPSKVLANAAAFFAVSEKAMAEQVLLRGMKEDPTASNPGMEGQVYRPVWAARLGHLYARAIVGSDDDTLFNVVRSASLEEAHSPFAVHAKKTLETSTDSALLRAAGQYLTQNAGGRDGLIGDQKISLGFDHRALGNSYLDRAAALDPDSETTRRFETYRKRAADQERLFALANERLGGWRRATLEAVAALSEPDRVALLPMLATEAIMWAEAAEHDKNIKDDAGQQYAKARAFSDQALQLVNKLGAGGGTSELRVTGHMARGIVALRDGERAAAVSHLKASTEGVDVNVVVEDHLWSRLTNYLLAAGERETVAQFFDTLSRASNGQRFADAAKAIRAGQMPDSYQRQMTAR